MEFEKLINARKSKGWSQSHMAEMVSMEQTTYSRKERGVSHITDDEWVRFATALNLSVDDIKEERMYARNENCVFNDHSIGIQYVNIPKDFYEIFLKYHQKLEAEIEDLKKQKH